MLMWLQGVVKLLSKVVKLNLESADLCECLQRVIVYTLAEINSDFVACGDKSPWCLLLFGSLYCRSKYTYLSPSLIPYRGLLSSVVLKVTQIKPFISREFAENPSAQLLNLNLEVIVSQSSIQRERQS